MSALLIFSFLRWAHVLQTIVLILGTTVCFVTAIYNKHVSWYLPFISETGAQAPEVGIFSITLIIGSFMGILMVLYRFVSIALTTPMENKDLFKWNKISCITGILSMLGLAGVAAFPMSTVFWVHLLSAGVYFSNMMFYALSTTYFTFKKDGFSNVLKLRLVLCFLIVIILGFLICLFPIAHTKWHDENLIIPALKEPKNKGFVLIFISSLLEWTFMIVTLVYTLTLLIEVQTNQFLLTIYEKREESPLSVNANAMSQIEEGHNDSQIQVDEKNFY